MSECKYCHAIGPCESCANLRASLAAAEAKLRDAERERDEARLEAYAERHRYERREELLRANQAVAEAAEARAGEYLDAIGCSLCADILPCDRHPGIVAAKTGRGWLGTHRENMLDSVAKKRQVNIRKTHCIRGHELSGRNLIERDRRNGERGCRACHALYCREQRKRSKARAALAKGKP